MGNRGVEAKAMFDFVDLEKWEKNSAKWIAALRSGRYEQTQSQLKDSFGKSKSYCCLGLACQIGRVKQVKVGHNYHFGSAQVAMLPPAEFAQWLGFDPYSVERTFNEYESSYNNEVQVLLNNPRVVKKGFRYQNWDGTYSWTPLAAYESLADLNDNGASFEEIADLIERYGIQMRWSA